MTINAASGRHFSFRVYAGAQNEAFEPPDAQHIKVYPSINAARRAAFAE
jgi:hypothetical protein